MGKQDHILIDNQEGRRYEFEIGTHRPRIEYIRAGDRIYLTHTEVPSELAGKGIGTALIASALEAIEQEGLALVPLCPFVALYLQRNPEWKRLVMKGINIA